MIRAEISVPTDESIAIADECRWDYRAYHLPNIDRGLHRYLRPDPPRGSLRVHIRRWLAGEDSETTPRHLPDEKSASLCPGRPLRLSFTGLFGHDYAACEESRRARPVRVYGRTRESNPWSRKSNPGPRDEDYRELQASLDQHT